MLAIRWRGAGAPASACARAKRRRPSASTSNLSSTSGIGLLERGARAPQLGEELDVEHAPQVIHSRGAAGAALQPDHALDRRRVAEAPLPKGVLEVHQLLGQFVEVPVRPGRAIALHPRLAGPFVVGVYGAPLALDTLRLH